MRDTIGKRIYRCKCGTIQEEFVWSSEVGKREFECGKCGKALRHDNLKVKSKVGIISIRTPTKNR